MGSVKHVNIQQYMDFVNTPSKATAQAQAKLRPALVEGLGSAWPSLKPWAPQSWAQAEAFRLSWAHTSLVTAIVRVPKEMVC